MGPEAPRARRRRAARAVGGAGRRLLRQGLRRHLPRPAAHAGGRSARSEVDRCSLAAMFVLAALCLLAGILPGLVIDALAPVVQALVGARMPRADRARRGCRSCRSPRAAAPTTACWSSSSSRSRRSLAVEVIHRFASRAVRRGPAWDCGFPDPSPATQYTADSFAQPIRRVFGTRGVPRPRARRHAAARRCAAGALSRHAARSRLGRASMRPIAGAVGVAADRAQPAAVPDHPPLPDPGLRRARRACSLVVAIWR